MKKRFQKIFLRSDRLRAHVAEILLVLAEAQDFLKGFMYFLVYWLSTFLCTIPSRFCLHFRPKCKNILTEILEKSEACSSFSPPTLKVTRWKSSEDIYELHLWTAQSFPKNYYYFLESQQCKNPVILFFLKIVLTATNMSLSKAKSREH